MVHISYNLPVGKVKLRRFAELALDFNQFAIQLQFIYISQQRVNDSWAEVLFGKINFPLPAAPGKQLPNDFSDD